MDYFVNVVFIKHKPLICCESLVLKYFQECSWIPWNPFLASSPLPGHIRLPPHETDTVALMMCYDRLQQLTMTGNSTTPSILSTSVFLLDQTLLSQPPEERCELQNKFYKTHVDKITFLSTNSKLKGNWRNAFELHDIVLPRVVEYLFIFKHNRNNANLTW